MWPIVAERRSAGRPELCRQRDAEGFAEAPGEFRRRVCVLDRPHLLDGVRRGQRRHRACGRDVETAEQACDQARPVCVAGAGWIGLDARGRGRVRLRAGVDVRALPPKRGHDQLRQLLQPIQVPTGALLNQLELVIVADQHPGAACTVDEVIAGHVRKLVSGVEHPGHAPVPALVHQALHRVGRIRSHDHRLGIRHRVVEAEAAREVHGAAVVAGDLVVVEVGSGEARGGDLPLDEAQAPAVDPHLLQPGAIFESVGSGSREHGAGIAEQREVERVVARHAASALLEVVDQEAEVEDVGLVGEDVVFEPALEAQDVVEGDGAGADHAHSRERLTEGAERKKGGAVAPPSFGDSAYAAALRREVVRRTARRAVRALRGAAACRPGSSLALASRLATRATVLNDPLKIFKDCVATSPTASWRFAWTLTSCRPRTAMRSGSRSPTTFSADLLAWSSFLAKPLTTSLAGAVAALNCRLSRRLTLRAVGAPLRSKPLTCLRAEPIGSDATSLAALAAPNATSSTVDVMSVLNSSP